MAPWSPRVGGKLVEGELSVAVPPERAVDYLPQRLAKFHEEYPDVRVRISTAEGELGVLDLVRSAS
ncbi:MAG: LysR substrate-binding domain-containing protein [Deltaproteobacteria bacterium]